MKTNDLKKGVVVLLRNGWQAVLLDNKKGNTRLAEVDGFCKESGSIYSHDIVAHMPENQWVYDIEYTTSQIACKAMADSF